MLLAMAVLLLHPQLPADKAKIHPMSVEVAPPTSSRSGPRTGTLSATLCFFNQDRAQQRR